MWKTIVSNTTGACASGLVGMAANVVLNKYTQGMPLPLRLVTWATALVGAVGVGIVVQNEVTDTMDLYLGNCD